MMHLLALLACMAYLVAAGLLARSVLDDRDARQPALAFATAGALLHAGLHGLETATLGAPGLQFFAALSLVGLVMTILTLLAAWIERTEALGVLVFPIAGASVLLFGFTERTSPPALDWRIQLHAWLALLAYATLAVTALMAAMLWAQERALRRRQLGTVLRALPPLTQLETLLFRSIAAGFLLLSLALVSGVLFVSDLLAQHLAHKTVLSVLAWLVFGLLLLGRWRFGWRGRRAVRWTLAGMTLLLLAFFGSKFVLELLLQRAAG